MTYTEIAKPGSRWQIQEKFFQMNGFNLFLEMRWNAHCSG